MLNVLVPNTEMMSSSLLKNDLFLKRKRISVFNFFLVSRIGRSDWGRRKQEGIGNLTMRALTLSQTAEFCENEIDVTFEAKQLVILCAGDPTSRFDCERTRGV